MEIVYKDKNSVVINKPAGIPSQADKSGDTDALSLTAAALREAGESNELFLVHRLDRTVGGLMVFARNKDSAAALSSEIAEGSFEKEYIAVCRGKCDGGHLTDMLYKDARLGKAFVAKAPRHDAKTAQLIATPLCTKSIFGKEITLLAVKLITGRFHQIRAQLSSRGNPLLGDKKYGDGDRLAKSVALFSYKLSYRLFGKSVDISIMPKMLDYPWREFSDEITKIADTKRQSD